MSSTRTLGVIVNPIAGMGGRVGLKGTDGPETVRCARALGAEPHAPARARLALDAIATRLLGEIELVAAAGEMGEDVARAAGFRPRVVGAIVPGATTPEDTERAAAAMREVGVELLLFAGGDGTARNIAHALVGRELPLLGIPAGVKMHSAVYATSPRAAAALVVRHLGGPSLRCGDAEVMDIDEDAFRDGRVSARLYGYVQVPREPGLVQGLKAGSAGREDAALAGLAAEVVERMDAGTLWVIGPGTTTRAITDRLGLPKTLLGVDVVRGGALVATDVAETQLLDLVRGGQARIVVTPIGGQGYLFGRGNQQISPRVLERVGRDHVVIVATPGKLAALRGQPFLLDTGDPALDLALAGYVRVVTGYRSEVAYRIAG